jgi:hypothetical protein
MGRKQPAEQIAGRFAGIPHAVMDSAAFMGASHHARSLLFELIRQHTGRNNGHFQLARTWLNARGWNSADVFQRAKAELIERQLAIKTRLGGLNAGPDLWAITWLPISDYSGLTEVSAKTYHPGAWHFLDKAPLMTRKSPDENCDKRSAQRNSAEPPGGTVPRPAVPPSGTENASFEHSAVPSGGNNEVTSSPRRYVPRRVVGKKRTETSPTGARASPIDDMEKSAASFGDWAARAESRTIKHAVDTVGSSQNAEKL